MKPVVDRLGGQYAGRVDFLVYGDVNADAKVSEFATKQGVRAVPTMALVSSDGTELERIVGGVTERRLRDVLDGALD